MKASIIITTFNRPIFLKRAIVSCFHQITDYNYEIIVVDDNGLNTPIQKETFKLVQQYSEILYLALEENSGACIARNKGVENAKGEYIFFLDDDDEFLPNKIQTQVDFLNKNLQLDGCLAAFKRINQENNLEIVSEANRPSVGSFKEFVLKGNFFTPMICIRKSSLIRIGGFDIIDRFQDRFLMLKALSVGLKFETSSEQLHIMYEHNDIRITQASIKKSIDSLDLIKDFISNHNNNFNDTEWNNYLLKDLRMRGMIYYTSSDYFNRMYGLKYFLEAFLYSVDKKDLLMVIKSVLKIKLIKRNK